MLIDVNKTSESKECDICHYWYFLDKGFKFQLDVSNGCYNVLRISMNLSSEIAILSIHGANYRCIINGMSKNKAINCLKNVDLTEKSRTSQNIKAWDKVRADIKKEFDSEPVYKKRFCKSK